MVPNNSLQSMRHTLQTAILAMLFLAAGCAKYDRELMGDPQPREAEPASAVETQTAPTPADSDSMGVGMFNDLDYYGQWYQRDPYGWVWRPNVVMDWQPFLHGNWIWTQYGWMWADYDPWGWATSHYGYWTTDFTLGWIWIPDYTWSPVQCDWMQYGDYIGWCPVAPPGAAFKNPWDGSKAWVWVPIRKFKQVDVGSYRAAPKFKSGSATDIARGAPTIADVQAHGAGIFPLVDVQLDRRTVHDREFAKVKYPPNQQEIIAEYRRVSMKSVGGGLTTTPAPVRLNPGGGFNDPNAPVNVGPVQPQQPSTQTRSKSSSKSGSGKTTSKYKSTKHQEKKDGGKSKGDSDTDKKEKG